MTNIPTVGDEIGEDSSYMPVDYAKNAVEVYEDLMIYLISRQDSLDLLLARASFGGRLDAEKVDLPSWVIKWTVGDVTLSQPGRTRGFYSADLTRQRGILNLQGRLLGTVRGKYQEPEAILTNVGIPELQKRVQRAQIKALTTASSYYKEKRVDKTIGETRAGTWFSERDSRLQKRKATAPEMLQAQLVSEVGRICNVSRAPHNYPEDQLYWVEISGSAAAIEDDLATAVALCDPRRSESGRLQCLWYLPWTAGQSDILVCTQGAGWPLILRPLRSVSALQDGTGRHAFIGVAWVKARSTDKANVALVFVEDRMWAPHSETEPLVNFYLQ